MTSSKIAALLRKNNLNLLSIILKFIWCKLAIIMKITTQNKVLFFAIVFGISLIQKGQKTFDFKFDKVIIVQR